MPKPGLESALMRAWQTRGWLARALWPLSCLFRALVALRRGLYRWGIFKSTRLPVPVIVVGNLFVGGTGKTPLVIWLCAALTRAGFVPGVISRGHGGSRHAPILVEADAAPAEVGDEPLLIRRRTGAPVMVGRDRVAAARALLAARPEVNVIIADDGLQHYALGRTLEIVLSDERGAGNGWMLPAGPLREPVTRARDFSVFNGPSAQAPAHAYAMELVAGELEALADRRQRRPLRSLAAAADGTDGGGGARITAAAGIGNPERFFTMLERHGLRIERLPLPDHYAYLDNPFAALGADIILVTEKDAVKCERLAALQQDARLWIVPVQAQVDGLLAAKIVERIRGYQTA